MSRPSPGLALLSMSFLTLACGPVHDHHDGEFGGDGGVFDDGADPADDDPDAPPSGGDDDDDDAPTPGDGGDDDDDDDDAAEPESPEEPEEVASPVIPTPSIACPEHVCVEGGVGTEELTGRDLVRAMFFRGAGYPDEMTWMSHTAGAMSGSPFDGVLGTVLEAIGEANEVLEDAGYLDCAALPIEGEHPLGGSYSMTMVEPEHAPPSGFPHVGNDFQRAFRIDGPDGISTHVELGCGYPAAFVAVQRPYGDGEDRERIDFYFDHADMGRAMVELAAHRPAPEERIALRFETDGDHFALWSVRAFEEAPAMMSGQRVFAHGDALDQRASALGQSLAPSLELHRVPAAAGAGLLPQDDASVLCADFVADDPTTGSGSLCRALDLPMPPAPAFGQDATWSIAWAAQPAGEKGLVDGMFEL